MKLTGNKKTNNRQSVGFNEKNVNMTILLSGITRQSEFEEIRDAVKSKIRKFNNDNLNSKIKYKITLDSQPNANQAP